MKYTIELTNKQRAVLESLLEIIHRHIGFNVTLEPMEIVPIKDTQAYEQGFEDGKNEARKVKAVNVEDTNEYQIGYKTGYDIAQCNAQATKEEWGKIEYDRGFEDGKNKAIYNTDLIEELKQAEYDKGYNSAINDYNAMYEWLHDCFVDFEKFLLEKGFYTDEKFSDGFVVGQLMYDLICDFDIAEVIAEFKKWREEKKKVDEIKVGDEVKDLATNNIGIVLSIGQMVVYITEINHVYSNTRGSLEKTGRHFDEVEQLLDKLKK